jgi:hypothetical protein
LAIAIPTPAVERALDSVSFDEPAVTQMRAEVRAMSFDHAGRAILGAEQYQVAPEVTQRFDVARFDITTDANSEPPARI